MDNFGDSAARLVNEVNASFHTDKKKVFIQLKNKNKCENYIWQSFITSSCSSVGDNQEAKINGSIGQASYLRHRLQKVARKTFPTLKDMLKGSSMIFVLEI